MYQLYCRGKGGKGGKSPSQVQSTGVYQLYRQIQRDHVQNIFYNYLLYPKYSIGGALVYLSSANANYYWSHLPCEALTQKGES